MEDFMVREVTFIPLETSYYDIFRLLKCTAYRAYPLVDSEGMYVIIILVTGFVQVLKILESQWAIPRILSHQSRFIS